MTNAFKCDTPAPSAAESPVNSHCLSLLKRRSNSWTKRCKMSFPSRRYGPRCTKAGASTREWFTIYFVPMHISIQTVDQQYHIHIMHNYTTGSIEWSTICICHVTFLASATAKSSISTALKALSPMEMGGEDGGMDHMAGLPTWLSWESLGAKGPLTPFAWFCIYHHLSVRMSRKGAGFGMRSKNLNCKGQPKGFWLLFVQDVPCNKVVAHL